MKPMTKAEKLLQLKRIAKPPDAQRVAKLEAEIKRLRAELAKAKADR